MTQPSVERLTPQHDLDAFDCGTPALDTWLRSYALKNQQQDGCVTYVAHLSGRVVGFHALVVGSVERENAPSAPTRRMGRYPVPVILLARLAVDRPHQGTGLGRGLLRDALTRSARAADIAGAKAVVVDAKEGADGFYERFGFRPFPTDPQRMYVTMAAVRAQTG
jgi:predicted N-acetyltransferase YhbS